MLRAHHRGQFDFRVIEEEIQRVAPLRIDRAGVDDDSDPFAPDEVELILKEDFQAWLNKSHCGCSGRIIIGALETQGQAMRRIPF